MESNTKSGPMLLGVCFQFPDSYIVHTEIIFKKRVRKVIIEVS